MHSEDPIRLAGLWIAVVMLASATSLGCQRPELPASMQFLDRPNAGHRPQLIVDESVAPDFELLAIETWDQFLAVFGGRSDCFGDVHLRATKDLDSRASYDPDTAAVTVRVPGTPAMLKGALIHEWAHHIEFQCREHQELRQPFLVAQGLSPDTPWRPHDEPEQMPVGDWASIPSEQYAEATIVLVLGARHIPTKARVTGEAVQVIEAWAQAD